MRGNIFVLLWVGLTLAVVSGERVQACSTLIVTKGASADGSLFVAHSDDSEMFDNRLIYVPAATAATKA